MCISKPVLPPLEMREQGIAPTATAELLPASSKHTSNRSASCSYAINLMCVGIDYPHIVMRLPLLLKEVTGQLLTELSDDIRQRNRLDMHRTNLHRIMRKESRGWPPRVARALRVHDARAKRQQKHATIQANTKSQCEGCSLKSLEINTNKVQAHNAKVATSRANNQHNQLNQHNAKVAASRANNQHNQFNQHNAKVATSRATNKHNE